MKKKMRDRKEEQLPLFLQKHRRLCTVLAFAVVILGISAAGAVILSGNRKEREPVRMIFIPKVMDDSDFWTQMVEGARMGAAEYGVELLLVAADSENDYERQNELIAWAVEQQPDAILLSPSSYTENTQMARRAVESGCKLILIDSDIDEDLAVSRISTNNVRAGMLQGEYIRELLAENSRIAIIGHVRNSSTAIEREKGVRQGLGRDEERIGEVVFCDSDSDKAYLQLQELVEKYPDIDVVAGLNEYSAVGAARAVKELKLTNRIHVVGFDSSPEEIQYLEAGVFDAIVIQKAFKMGYLGVEAAVKAVKGENVLKNIDSGSVLITRDNMYTEENQKLLFPFREEE